MWTERLRTDTARMIAVRDSWRALWSSRLLVWVVGVASVGLLGVGPAGEAYDPRGLTRGLGRVGEALAGPAARWDAAWYLEIAKSGYQPDLGIHTLSRAAFFPAYPLAIRAVSFVGIPLIVAGVLVSLCAFAAALYGIHRLTTLEFARTELVGDRQPEQIARLAVLVMAFTPMALFFSAIYTESLFLASSVALFWSARHGRWAWVGLAGALAVATRSTGFVLALPALVIYFYGPREDRPQTARARTLLPARPAASLPTLAEWARRCDRDTGCDRRCCGSRCYRRPSSSSRARSRCQEAKRSRRSRLSTRSGGASSWGRS